MKKTLLAFILCLALVLSLTACGNVPTSEAESPAVEPKDAASETAEPQVTADVQTPAQDDGQTVPAETAEPVAETRRQDGERFEEVIIMEGMEETVQYEHVINETAGFEMDYDYESFVRRSESDRERFILAWDDPENPENYLEVTYSSEDAETVAAAISEELSKDYDINRSSFALDRAGSCIRIDACEVKGGGYTADQMQTVDIIPTADGCLIATAHFSAEGAEGFGRRFAYMMNTLSLIDR